MCTSSGCTHGAHAAASSATSAVSTAAPAVENIHNLLKKKKGLLRRIDDETLGVQFIDKPWKTGKYGLEEICKAGKIVDGTYEPQGMFGDNNLNALWGGMLALKTVATTDWNAQATNLKTNLSSCYAGLTSNLSRLSTSDAAPWLLLAAGTGMAALAYRSYRKSRATDKIGETTADCTDATGCGTSAQSGLSNMTNRLASMFSSATKNVRPVVAA